MPNCWMNLLDEVHEIFLRIFWSLWKIRPKVLTYSNANAEVKDWIFDAQFQRNWFEFGIILNDF